MTTNCLLEAELMTCSTPAGLWLFDSNARPVTTNGANGRGFIGLRTVMTGQSRPWTVRDAIDFTPGGDTGFV